jgi:CheY-like chemotaxis protein
MLKSVLIADDSAFRQRVVIFSAAKLDFKVCALAENGRMAIQKAQDLRPDVILLDLAMPVMNGFEAARALKRLMPNVPIVVFSAYADSFTEKVGIARNLVGAIAA